SPTRRYRHPVGGPPRRVLSSQPSPSAWCLGGPPAGKVRGMGTVVITGVDSPLGRRVVGLAADDPDVGTVVALAGRPVVGLSEDVDLRRIDLGFDDVKPHLEDAEAVVHVATSVPAAPSAPTSEADPALR